MATSLLTWGGGGPTLVALYMIVLVLMTVVSVALAKKTNRQSIEQ